MNTKRLIISLVVSGLISIIIFFISNDFGIVWDEPIYFRNADEYISWFKKPELRGIEKSFNPTVTDAHPPFRKLTAGFTHELFTKYVPILDNTRAYRISYLIFVIPFITVFTYVAIGQLGYTVGLLVPFMYSLLPHILFMTPLVTMDYAIAGMWFITIIAAMKAMKYYRWLFISGVSLGVTMLMKLHGFLLFLPVGMYWVCSKKHKDFLLRVFIFLLVILIVYIAGWPWLWFHTLERLGIYFQIQLDHSNIPVYVLGKIYTQAPWWYIPIMFFTTTPIFVLVPLVFGVFQTIKQRNIFMCIMALNALYPMVFFSLPWVYRYDGIRLFLASYPFVCLLAGYGIMTGIKLLRAKYRTLSFAFIVFLWIVTVYSSVIRIHPFESAYYNEFVGGIDGASRLGLETEYWGNSYFEILPWMNSHKNEMMCVWPTTHPFYYYQAMGTLESGVVFNASQNSCKYGIVLMRQGLFGKNTYIDEMVKNQKPIYTVSVGKTVLVGVYEVKSKK